VVCVLASTSAQAFPFIIFGEDQNFSNAPEVPGPQIDNPDALGGAAQNFTVSDAARDYFYSFLININEEDFEGPGFTSGQPGLPPGVLTFGGVTATLDANPLDPNVWSVPGDIPGPPIDTSTFFGTYPTSGDNFVLMQAGINAGNGVPFNAQIIFNEPVTAFGFYATDVGDGGSITGFTMFYPTGSTHITIPHTVTTESANSGSVFFMGVIDPYAEFTSVLFTTNGAASEGFGLDDMVVGDLPDVNIPKVIDAQNIPEPGTFVLLGSGIGVALFKLRRRRRLAQTPPQA
jgi:hypothetical protein